MLASTINRPPRALVKIVGTAMAASLLLAACGGGEGDSGKTEITMWTFLDPDGSSGRETVLSDLIDSYEDEHPNTTINVEVQQWDTLTSQFLAADASNSAPDVIWAVVDEFADVAEQGALANLNDLSFGDMPDDQLEDLRDIYWDSMTTEDGEINGVVHSRNYLGLMYRKDYFEEADIDPADIETWDDLIEAAQELTVSDDNRWGLGQAFSDSFADPQILTAKLLEEQGTLFSDDGEAAWANDAGVKALEFQASLIEEHQVTSEDAVRLTSEDLYELFSSGQLAIFNAASARVPEMQKELGVENVGFMHYPGDVANEHAPGTLLGWAVGVWEGSDSKEEAADFVAHLSSPEADAAWLTEAQQPPLYSSTSEENNDYLNEPENEFLNVVVEGTEDYGWLPPTQTPTGGWKSILNTTVQKVLLDGTSAMDALESAETDFNS